MGLDKSAINPATGKAYAINPASNQWDDNYFATQVEPRYNATNPQPGQSAQNAIDTATKLRDFTIQSNQPAIQSYEASKSPLQDRYKNLLDTIKGNQQVAENRQTVTTNNELGKRGISNDSGVYQQAMTDSLNPITSSFTGQYKDALSNQNVDLSAIDRAIAELKSGNPAGNVSAALQLGGQEQSANEFSQNLALQQAQLELQKQQAAKTQQPDRYINIGAGGLYDTQSGQVVQGMQSLKSQLGGGYGGF